MSFSFSKESTHDSDRPKRRGSVWNTLAVLCLGLTGVSCLCTSAVFINPYLPLNPFPPPTEFRLAPNDTPAAAAGPTTTRGPNLSPLPPEQTATPGAGISGPVGEFTATQERLQTAASPVVTPSERGETATTLAVTNTLAPPTNTPGGIGYVPPGASSPTPGGAYPPP
jgi:hypothetical protein